MRLLCISAASSSFPVGNVLLGGLLFHTASSVHISIPYSLHKFYISLQNEPSCLSPLYGCPVWPSKDLTSLSMFSNFRDSAPMASNMDSSLPFLTSLVLSTWFTFTFSRFGKCFEVLSKFVDNAVCT